MASPRRRSIIPSSGANGLSRSVGTLSPEQAHLIDVDRAFFIGDAADRAALEADPMFTSLPIYRDGRVTFFADSEDPPVGAALSQSTILSLPYAIDQVS
nr:hypothetical protein [Rhodococcus opacus]